MGIKYFEFTKTDYDYFIKEGMLDDDYAKLLEYKIKGYSIVKIADLLSCSQSKVSTMVKDLNNKIKKIL